MRRLFLFLLLCITGTAIADPIVLTHASPKGSQSDVELEYISKTLSSAGVASEYQATGNCADTVKFWNSTKKPVIMQYTSTWPRRSKIEGKQCVADLNNSVIVQRRITPLWFCSAPTAKPLTSSGLKIGLNYPVEFLTDEIQRSNRYKWKVIKTNQGFKDSMAQLANGEIDYNFLIKGGSGLVDRVKKGEIKCYASSMPGDDLPYMNKYFNITRDSNVTLSFYTVIVAKNLSDDQLKIVKTQLGSDNKETKDYVAFNNLNNIPLDKDNNKMLKEFWDFTYALFDSNFKEEN